MKTKTIFSLYHAQTLTMRFPFSETIAYPTIKLYYFQKFFYSIRKIASVDMVKDGNIEGKSWIDIAMSYDQFVDGNVLRERIEEFVPIDGTFTAQVKMRYSNNLHATAGHQFGGINSSIEALKEIQNTALSRVEIILLKYKLRKSAVSYISIRIAKTHPTFQKEFGLIKSTDMEPELSDTLDENDIEIDDSPIESNILGHFVRSFSTFLSKKKTFDSAKANKALSVPTANAFTVNPEILKVDTHNGFITKIYIEPDINFLDVIKFKSSLLPSNNPDKITSFTDDYIFYYPATGSSSRYVLAVRTINGVTTKIKFSTNGGVITRTEDTVTDNIVSRSYNNSKDIMLLDTDKGIVRTVKTKVSLKPLTVKNALTPIPKNNIGCIDLETFEHTKDGIAKVYAAGFKTELDNEPVCFYVDTDLDCRKVVLNLINELLKPKYADIKFYCHNLSGFDVVFIVNAILTYNEEVSEDMKYQCSYKFKDDKILELVIKANVPLDDTKPNVKNKTKKRKLILRDSYTILTDSLSTLAKNLEVSTKKSVFPYDFVSEDKLFYIGNSPESKYYNKDDLINQSLVDNTEWNLKEEALKYLKNDLNALFEVLHKANKQIHIDYGIDMTSRLTISGLSMSLFLSKYYSKYVIPNIKTVKIFQDLQKAYFGGITEVYKPYGTNLYYYDVNSLYPSVAYNDMPGLDCWNINFKTQPDISDKNFFGFFYCKISTPDDLYFGLLPFRDKNGVHFRLGNWEGWYFSEELKFAKENGYTIHVVKGYSFSRESNLFDEYINDVYKIKSYPKNNTQKTMAKSMLNNFLGRFGINIMKPTTSIMDVELYNTYIKMYKINSFKELTPSKYLVTYYPSLDLDIIKEHNLDIAKLARKYPDKESIDASNASIVISSAVNSYARIHMSKLKLDILKTGASIYYSDTDSIVTDRKLDDSLVSNKDIGKLKLEYKVKEGIFISGKLYALLTDDNKTIIKSKGFDKSSLTWDDFKGLLDEKNTTAIKKMSKKSWPEGSVSIYTIQATVNAIPSEKRRRVLKKGKWIDTKPVFMRHTKKSDKKPDEDSKLAIYKLPSTELISYNTEIPINNLEDTNNKITSSISTAPLIYNFKSEPVIKEKLNLGVVLTTIVVLTLCFLAVILDEDAFWYSHDKDEVYLNTNKAKTDEIPNKVETTLIDLEESYSEIDSDFTTLNNLYTEYYNIEHESYLQENIKQVPIGWNPDFGSETPDWDAYYEDLEIREEEARMAKEGELLINQTYDDYILLKALQNIEDLKYDNDRLRKIVFKNRVDYEDKSVQTDYVYNADETLIDIEENDLYEGDSNSFPEVKDISTQTFMSKDDIRKLEIRVEINNTKELLRIKEEEIKKILEQSIPKVKEKSITEVKESSRLSALERFMKMKADDNKFIDESTKNLIELERRIHLGQYKLVSESLARTIFDKSPKDNLTGEIGEIIANMQDKMQKNSDQKASYDFESVEEQYKDKMDDIDRMFKSERINIPASEFEETNIEQSSSKSEVSQMDAENQGFSEENIDKFI